MENSSRKLNDGKNEYKIYGLALMENNINKINMEQFSLFRTF